MLVACKHDNDLCVAINYNRFKLVIWTFLFFSVLLFLNHDAAYAVEELSESDDITLFEIDSPSEHQISGGESHFYHIELAAGEYLFVNVEQKGIDVVVIVTDPDSQRVAEYDSPNGAQGPEPVEFIGERAGLYHLEVKSLQDDANAGQYTLVKREHRQATDADKNRITAKRYENEARSLYRKGTADDLNASRKKYLEAASLWQQAGDIGKQADCLQAVGVIHSYLDEHGQAISAYKQALALSRTLSDSSRIANALASMGGSYSKIGEKDRALDCYLEALAINKKLAVHKSVCLVLNFIGQIYDSRGERQKALDYFQESLALSQSINYLWAQAYSLESIAFLYGSTGELSKSLDYREKSLEIFRKLGDRRSEGLAILNMGYIRDLMGEKQHALQHYKEACDIAELLGNRGMRATALNNIGFIYFDFNDGQTALEYFAKALAIRQEIEDKRGEASTLNGMGLVYFVREEYEKAKECFEQAYSLYRATDDRPGQAIGLMHLGMVHDSMEEYEKAIDYLTESLNIRRDVHDRYGECNTLTRLGVVYFNMADYANSIAYLNESIALSREVGHDRNESIALFHLARAEHNNKNAAFARTCIEESINKLESIRTTVINSDLRSLFFAGVSNYYEFYIDLLMQPHQDESDTGNFLTAFHVNEQRLARSLLDILSETRKDIYRGLPADFVGRERELRNQINIREQRRLELVQKNYAADSLARVKNDIQNLLKQYEELETEIRLASPQYADLLRPHVLSVRDIQEQVLDENTTLLEYSLGEKNSYLWIVRQNSVRTFVLPKRADIEAAAKKLYNLINSRNQFGLQETPQEKSQRLATAETALPDALNELSDMVLGEWLYDIQTQRLVIVCEGALQYIPFGILQIPGEKKSNHLIAHYEVVSLPSASVVPLLRDRSTSPGRADRSILVLADPVFSPHDPRVQQTLLAEQDTVSFAQAGAEISVEQEFMTRSVQEFGYDGLFDIPRLPFSRLEAEAIVASAPQTQSTLALDFDANYNMVMEPELHKYQIVHIATHGLLNSAHPQLSGLVLSLVDKSGAATNGFLRLHDIFNLDLDADLVVLSACQTALGKEIRGEGLIGLTRGFMYAGASRVVASLWKVDDEATAELMRRFYGFMLSEEQLSPAAALRQAQLSILQEKRWNSPYYWAAFVMQGDWQ
ncbi:CHAT domain-containing protein [candidate division KSB1 bacterium]|nr:CHAT domain-containing protein [candidate division KSB1 bacterium]RQW01001.1 MAG: CHAT domain-containing protein [candidate division KSB1 bacterium]